MRIHGTWFASAYKSRIFMLSAIVYATAKRQELSPAGVCTVIMTSPIVNVYNRISQS